MMGREVRATPGISMLAGIGTVLISVGLVVAVLLGRAWGPATDQWRVQRPVVVVDPGGVVTVPGWRSQ